MEGGLIGSDEIPRSPETCLKHCSDDASNIEASGTTQGLDARVACSMPESLTTQGAHGLTQSRDSIELRKEEMQKGLFCYDPSLFAQTRDSIELRKQEIQKVLIDQNPSLFPQTRDSIELRQETIPKGLVDQDPSLVTQNIDGVNPKAQQVRRRRLRSAMQNFIRKSTPWKETEEVTYGEYLLQRAVEVNVPTHGCCMFIYLALLLAYAIYAIVMWVLAPPVETFSMMESSLFGTMTLTLEPQCPTAVINSNVKKTWGVFYDYNGSTWCGGLDSKQTYDEPSVEVPLCRTTDDIRDAKGVRVWVGNLSVTATEGVNRCTILLKSGPDDTGLRITTPLEAWHEKTLLLGLVVQRNSEDCEEESCASDRQLYLASMQYDGHVSWGSVDWAGAQLNIRMLRFAQIYTKGPAQTIWDVLAVIGGASGLLITVLGAMRKFMEMVAVYGDSWREATRELVGSLAPAAVG